MDPNHKLFAALTTTGMVLSLILPANATKPIALRIEDGTGVVASPLSHRVDRMKAKLRTVSPRNSQGTIKNIVQFFNFSNCSKGKWHNC